MNLSKNTTTTIYGVFIALCFTPFFNPALALLSGIALSLLNIKHEKTGAYTSKALQISIVLMGFGMNLTQVITASKTGFIETATSVILVMSAGILLGRLFKLDSKIATLISAGTAICGGSAIAAVAPVLNSKNYQISFSLVVVFILNALALLIFPIIGHHFNMSQEMFGNWAAIAIHDTSSVVGASASYGDKALQVATTVKLIRALWIIPLSLVIAFFNKDKGNGKIKIPWFIFLFALSIVFAHLLPQWHDTYSHLQWLGKKGMVVALFLIGSGITIADAKQAGLKSFAFGFALWLLIGIGSLLVFLK